MGVTLAGKKVNLQLRAGKKATLARPAKSVQTVTLANDFRRKSSRAARTIQVWLQTHSDALDSTLILGSGCFHLAQSGGRF